MRSKTSEWYEVKLRYAKQQEDGSKKNVTELYVVDAISIPEAAKTIVDEMKTYISGEYKILDIKVTPYHEIFFSDADKDDKWFKAKLAFITIDDKTEKEKRSNVTYLVQASSLEKAVKNINEVMGGTMIDYSSVSVQETKILDVFEK